jgi:outer membrane protein assembly factor BamB
VVSTGPCNLVAYWSFDHGDATDDSGNENHGTVYGAILTYDRFGNPDSAFSFDGVDDYIEVADSDSLDVSKEITIIGWVNVNSYTDEWLGVVNKASSDDNDTFEICIHSSKYLHFPLNFQNSGRICYNSNPGLFNEGEWHFFGAVYDGTDVSIYIDGILSNSYTSTNESLKTNDHNLIIGAEKEDYNGPHYFNGILDEIRIYSKPLSESEIKELYVPGQQPLLMFHHDAQHTGRSPCAGPQNATVSWTYETGDEVASSPAIDGDGTIYLGSRDHKLYAMNPDGTLKWTYPTDGAINSSPAIGHDGTIYVGSLDYNLYAINSDGTLKWNYSAGGEINAPPTIGDDGTIYVGSYDHKLYALNPDGKLKCEYDVGGVIASSPTIDSDGVIYVGSSNGRLNALYPDCTLKWESDSPIHGIWIHPALSPDGTVVYYGADDGHLYARNTSDGSIKWRSTWSYGGIQSSPAIGSDGTIYVGTQYGNLCAIYPEDGTLKWDYHVTWSVWSSPAIGADSTIYFATNYGHVYAMNQDGTEKWVYNGNFDEDGHFRFSPAIGCNGTLYIGSTNGKLYAFGKPEYEADQVNDVPASRSAGCGVPPLGLGSLFQSFTPSAYFLWGTDLRLRAGGDFPDNGYHTTIRIRSDALDGAELATATVFVPGPQDTGTQPVVRFRFSPPVPVTPGDPYVIEWITPEEGDIVLTWMVVEGDPYLGGTAFGCQGISIPNEDFVFITYAIVNTPW